MRDALPWRLVTALLVLITFVALVVVPWGDWYGVSVRLADAMAPMSSAHPLGTDNLGRDLLGRLAEAARGAVLPLWGAVACGCLVGLLMGTTSLTWRQSRLGAVCARGLDAAASVAAGLPAVIGAFALAVLWEGGGLWPVMTSLAALFGLRTYLEVQDWARQDGRLGFWTAHTALGGTFAARLWRYGVLTAWREPLLQSLAFHLRAAVAIEAALSYLGFGVQEPQASFGNMLSSHFDLYLKGHWQTLVIIVAALTFSVAVPTAVAAIALAARGRHQVFGALKPLPVE
jgi:peptide/nickel transport system permease protein